MTSGRGGHHADRRRPTSASAKSWSSKVEQVRLHNNRIEELVTQLKQLNQRLTALEGQLLRIAEACKVPREEFLKHYRGQELDPNWVEQAVEAAGQGLEALRHQARDRHRQRAHADRRWSQTMPACRSASSAAST